MPVFFPPLPLYTAGSVLFADSAGLVAQNNTKFFWDDTNFILKAGAEIDLLANGAFVKALYAVYNASGNNWFVGEAGKTTMSGYNNTGVGGFSLFSLSSGDNNVAVGAAALFQLNGGGNNFGLGTGSLFNNVTGNANVAIGTHALFTTTGGGNVGIGENVLYSSNSFYNTAVGYVALYNCATVTGYNTAIGYAAGYNITAGDYNTLLGSWQGPAGAISNVIALSDGAGNLKLDYNYSSASSWTFGGAVKSTLVGVENFTVDCGGLSTQRAFVVYNGGSILGYIRGDGAVAGVYVETADDATAGLSQTAFGTASKGVYLYNSGTIAWSSTVHWWDTPMDVTLSRNAANVLQVGDGGSNANGTLIAKVVQTGTTTVGSLPAAGTKGRRSFVTDATATTFASIVAGTGGNNVPVYDDGTNWRIG